MKNVVYKIHKLDAFSDRVEKVLQPKVVRVRPNGLVNISNSMNFQ